MAGAGEALPRQCHLASHPRPAGRARFPTRARPSRDVTRRPRLRPRAPLRAAVSQQRRRALCRLHPGALPRDPGRGRRGRQGQGAVRRDCGRCGSLARSMKPPSQENGASQSGKLRPERQLAQGHSGGGGVPEGRGGAGAEVPPGLCWLRRVPPTPRPGGLPRAGDTFQPCLLKEQRKVGHPQESRVGTSFLGPRGPAPHSPGEASPKSQLS